MRYARPVAVGLFLTSWFCPLAAAVSAETWESTRVVDAKQYAGPAGRGYPYREKADQILRELDLRPGDVVVDIGAGDGWWSEKMASLVGPEGTIHAGEIKQEMVDKMKSKLAGLPQVKPYLCPTDSTGLGDGSCDLAFFSQVFHHVDLAKRVDYLRHLAKVVRPTGRLCIIEGYTMLSADGRMHGTLLSKLYQEAEEAGWVGVRHVLLPGTRFYVAIFVHKDLFPPEPAKSEPKSPAKPRD